MRLWKPTILTILLASLTIAPGAVAADASEAYTGFGEFQTETCDGPFEFPWAACFTIPSGASTVSASVDDDSGLHAVGWLLIEESDGSNVKNGFFCDSIDMGIPSHAARAHVVVQDPVLGSALICPGPASATTGTIQANFS